jgi:hypothetical protein
MAVFFLEALAAIAVALSVLDGGRVETHTSMFFLLPPQKGAI